MIRAGNEVFGLGWQGRLHVQNARALRQAGEFVWDDFSAAQLLYALQWFAGRERERTCPVCKSSWKDSAAAAGNGS